MAERWLLRILGRKTTPDFIPDPGRLRAVLRRTPHPFALAGASLRCVCDLPALDGIHDWDSRIDARAVMNGTGGARERAVRAEAARMHAEAGKDGDGA